MPDLVQGRELIFTSTDPDGDVFEIETSQREDFGWALYVGTSNPQGAYLSPSQARNAAAALIEGAYLIEARIKGDG